MRVIPILLSFALLPALADTPGQQARPVDFQREIRGLLSDNCFTCHGPDDQARKGKLRLDVREHALKGGASGEPAIVPGKPDKSELVRRITSQDGNEHMPPAKSGKKVSAQQLELLKKWIADGADYQTHWAYVAPKRPAVPTAASSWSRNAIDRFILARLEREGLAPSPEASRETLLRRLSLDLIGLPPTIEEIDAFLADTSPHAYEKQIERLLKSPHYGERWGRHWLDAARYADSDGFEKDKPRSVWMYRDWVVSALNRDMPYDRFIIEQMAGDLLATPPTPPSQGGDRQGVLTPPREGVAAGGSQGGAIATGFLRNSMINEEGGIDPEQFRMEAMFDRMDAIGKAVLGLAINCCQCHNHKFDPITQEDYYRMFAYLNDTHEASIATYPPDALMKRAELFRQVRELEDGLKHRRPDWIQRLASWEESVRNDQPVWTIVRVQNASDNAQRYVYHEDGSQTGWGYAPTKWTSQFSGKTEAKKITAFRLELLTDPNLPLGGPGRSPTGLCALSELSVEVADPAKPDQKNKVKLITASADYSNEERPLESMYDDKSNKKRVTGPVAFAIDAKDDTAWGIDAGPGRRNVDRKAVFVVEKPIELPNGALVTFHLKQNHGGWNSDDNQNNNLGRFRFSVTDADQVVADPLPRTVRELLDVPADKRTPAQLDALFSYWRTSVPDWKEVNAQIEELWKQHPEPVAQLTMLPRETSRQTFLLKRGDFLKPDRVVQPGVPGILHSLPANAEPDRLSFAKWLVDRNSPTTARAFVNRVWQAYFGTGLVGTSEDLGVQCEQPTHPELLDWLAVEFMEHGWSIKHLHRLIVGSATYRQSSAFSHRLSAIGQDKPLNKDFLPKADSRMPIADPDNRLLARGPRLRVEGEVVRDIALAASGSLNPKLGGPPAYPPAPDFLFKPPASYGPKSWIEDKGENRYRRALYTFRFRSVPYPVLTNFDTPNGDASCVRRVRSNTPLQALTTLNETLFMECARALGLKALAEGGGTDRERLVYAFRRCTGRRPADAEVQVLLAFLEKQMAKFGAADAKPWELAANDPAKPPTLPPGVTPAHAAAWTALARVLLNLDETITKE
jgi:mono/diheme cytochrome c family protein